jgi:predicted nucleic acid-binding protein
VVLVDTSVWIEYLDRVNPLVENDLENLLRTGQVATAGLVVAELRQGCRRSDQVRLVTAALEPLEYLEVDRACWLRAGELAGERTAKGFTLEIGDCILAALALRENCEIFTLDRDFEQIPGVKLYRLRQN